jgi:hypothetical protein
MSAEELRRAALEALGEHADERARDALAHASVSIVAGAAAWHGSAGAVQGHRVSLGVDARTLGVLRAAPALTDALCAAVAAAIATRPLETLLDLRLRWAPGSRASSAGYRDAPPPGEGSILEALVDYLEGSREHDLARLLAGAGVEEGASAELTVRLAPAARKSVRGDARAAATLTAALRDLLGDDGAPVRLR